MMNCFKPSGFLLMRPGKVLLAWGRIKIVAEGVGFEPTVGLLLRLISSQVPSTTQPPFHATTGRDALCGKRSAEQAHLRDHYETGTGLETGLRAAVQMLDA